MKTKKCILAGILLLCSFPLSFAGDFERVQRRNLWNAGHNAAGIRMDSVTISTAEIFGGYGQGRFRDTYMPESAWSVGASARTLVHLDRFSMDGAFSFENMEGKGMTGSMSSRPGYYPVDVIEFTPGTKTMQTYSVNGGISVDLGDMVVIGGGIDYMARNYTKRKDLRHTSWLMDLTVDAGVIVKPGNDFSLGISYFFNKSSEKMQAEELGISSESYYAFLDKGLIFGVHDIWTGGGLHLKDLGIGGFPVRENRHGVGLQADAGGFHAEFDYIYGKGKAGEKDITWFVFPSNEFALRLGYRFKPSVTNHFFRADASVKALVNNENVIVKETVGGVTTNVTYGSNRIYGRRNISGGLSYEAMAPSWGVTAGMRVGNSLEVSSLVYPYIYSDDILSGKVYLEGRAKVWRFEIEACLSYMQGKVRSSESVSDGAPEADSRPYRQTDWYNIGNEYKTAPRIAAGLSLKCDVWKGIYVSAAARYVRAFGLEYIAGPDRVESVLAVGYVF